MKFEKISDKKFNIFKKDALAYSQSIYGGYTGETASPGHNDQIKANGVVDSTTSLGHGRDDGFKDYNT